MDGAPIVNRRHDQFVELVRAGKMRRSPVVHIEPLGIISAFPDPLDVVGGTAGCDWVGIAGVC